MDAEIYAQLGIYQDVELSEDITVYYTSAPSSIEHFNKLIGDIRKKGLRQMSMPELLEAKLEVMEWTSVRKDEFKIKGGEGVLDWLKSALSRKEKFVQSIMSLAIGRIMLPYSHFLRDEIYSSEGVIYAPGRLPVITRVSPLIERPNLEYNLIGEPNSEYDKNELVIPDWKKAASISFDNNLYDSYLKIAEEDKEKDPIEKRAIVLNHREKFNIPFGDESKLSLFLLGQTGIQLERITHQRAIRYFKDHFYNRTKHLSLGDLLKSVKEFYQVDVNLIPPEVIDRQEVEIITGVSLRGYKINAEKFNDSWIRGIDPRSARKMAEKIKRREDELEQEDEKWAMANLIRE